MTTNNGDEIRVTSKHEHTPLEVERLKSYLAAAYEGDWLIRTVKPFFKNHPKLVEDLDWGYSCLQKRHKIILNAINLFKEEHPWLVDDFDMSDWKEKHGFE